MAVVNDSRSDSNRWKTDDVFRLIDTVKDCGAIYNPLDRNYFCRPYVENLWRDIDIELGKRPGASLSKWTNLRISFRREFQLLIKNKAKPSWVYFSKMLFLQPFLRKKRQQNEKLEGHIQEALQQISSITRGNFKNYIANIEQCDNEQQDVSVTDEIYEDENVWKQDTIIKEEESTVADSDCFIDETDHASEECNDDIEDDLNQYSTQDLSKDCEAKQQNDNNKNQSRYETESLDSVPNQRSLLKRKHEDPSSSDGKRSNVDVFIEKPKQPELFQSISTNSVSCECKTNPDAMFLMSLMPDIQLMSRKDKGKFKIEVQRIIQDLLYPDE